MPSSSSSPHQPLHNFALRDLKWSSNHRLCKIPTNSRNPENKTDHVSDKKPKILIRIRTNTTDKGADANANATTVFDNKNTEDDEESIPKTWNLRPRHPVTKLAHSNGAAPNINGGPVVQETKLHTPSRSTQLPRSGINDANIADKKNEKKKKRFSISLTKQEIEEDIYTLTGTKPARRPKKRAKNVQKELDCVFPGLWLHSITPDSYQVPDPPLKGI